MNTMNSLAPEVRQQFGELVMKMERDDASTAKDCRNGAAPGAVDLLPRVNGSHGMRPSPPKPGFDAQQDRGRPTYAASGVGAFKRLRTTMAASSSSRKNTRCLPRHGAQMGRSVTASWEPKLRNVHVWNTADRTSAAVFDVSVGDGGVVRFAYRRLEPRFSIPGLLFFAPALGRANLPIVQLDAGPRDLSATGQ